MVSQDKPMDAEAEEKVVRTVAEVGMAEGTLDFFQNDGVVTGNVHRGGVVHGQGDVTVQGEIAGNEQGPGVVDIGGIAVVENSVSHAKVSARHMVIKGDVSDSVLRSELGGEVQGSLSDTQVTLGCRTGEIQTLRQCRVETQRIQRDMDELKVKIGLGGRRFVRDYPEVDLQLGEILVPLRKELRVDLRSFDEAIEGQEVANVDRALEEFYMRVMVGMLTRSNRHYVSRNPNRHKIFLKLIEGLRKHILAVHEYDMQKKRIMELAGTREQVLADLVKPARLSLRVRGKVGPNVTIQIQQIKGYFENPSGTVDFDEALASVKFTEEDDGPAVEYTDLEGQTETQPAEGDGLQNGTFSLQEGRVSWRPAG